MGIRAPNLKLRLILGAATVVPGVAAAQSADPQLLALSCAGCHGPGGHSPGTVPSIDGRSAPAIAEALRSFRAGQPSSTVMGRVAKGYSDAEIDALAREIAARWK